MKISVSLTDEAAGLVNNLSAKHNISVSEVVRRGLAIQRFVERELDKGSEILVRDRNGNLERVEFIFS